MRGERARMMRSRSMRSWRLAPTALSVMLLVGTAAKAAGQTATRATASVPSPISFQENRGQTDPRVKFVSSGKTYALFLTPDETILSPRVAGGSPVRMRMVGASTNSTIAGREGLPGKVYYVGADAQGALTGAATFRRVKYSGIYRGIDLEYYG